MKNIEISRIDSKKPAVVMLHSAHTKLSLSHIKHWIEIFIESSINFSILLRDIKSYNEVAESFPKHQILYAKNPIDVERVIQRQPKLKTIFYMANMSKNIHLLRFNNLKHIYIGSKNSDQLSTVTKAYRAYDEIWISSYSQIDKFKDSIDTRHLDFKIVGKPQLKERFLSYKDSDKKDAILYILDKNKKISFFKYFGEFLLKLKDFRSYIISDSIDENHLTIFGKEHDLLIKTIDSSSLDFVIHEIKFIAIDISKVNIFLLAYNLPLVVYLPSDRELDSYNLHIPEEILYIFSNESEFFDIINRLQEKDILKEQRENYTEYLLGKDATINNSFIKELKALES